MRTRRRVVVAVVAAVVVLAAATVAAFLLLGGGDDDGSVQVTEGEPFEVDGVAVSGDWSVRASNIGGAEIDGMSLTLEEARGRTFDDPARDGLYVDLLADGEVVQEIRCLLPQMQEGETVTPLCGPLDEEPLQEYDGLRASVRG